MSPSRIPMHVMLRLGLAALAFGGLSSAPAGRGSPSKVQPAAVAQYSPWKAQGWTISEFQPDIPNGGRANTIAPKPEDPTKQLREKVVIIVASESGGLFKSINGGKTWKHLDGLKPYFTNSVAFLPGNTKVVIATTSEDYSKSNQGGIWRSGDEGLTWAPVYWKNPNTGKPGPNPSPSPPGMAEGYGAFEISIAPDTGRIYVASTAGLEIGDADGVNWSHKDLGVPEPQAISVLAMAASSPGGGNVILTGSAAGIRRSPDGGTTWKNATVSPGCNTLSGQAFVPGCILDMHAFGGSPFAKNQAYVVNADKEVHYSDDWGDTWKQIYARPGSFGPGCGGIAFVHANPSVQKGKLDMYFGDKCSMWRLTAPPLAGTSAFDYSGAWTELQLEHGDSRHIAFDSNNAPLLFADDGGLSATTDGGASWKLVGGGPDGYNALQIYQIRGQWIDNVTKNNLYFGTQDNELWSSTDSGVTWVGRDNEGDFFEPMPHVATEPDSQITYWRSSLNRLMKGPSLAVEPLAWNNPPGQAPGTTNPANVGRPKIVNKNFHVQWVQDAPGILSKGLAVTYQLSAANSWKQYAIINDKTQCGSCSRLDLPRAAYPAKGEPVLYQALATGTTDAATRLAEGVLARLLPRPNSDDATTDYPAMTNFGGFGIASTMEGWLRVYAVDPGDPNHLLAADVISEKMMESNDSGGTWHELGQLQSLVTDGGKLKFRGNMYFSQAPPLWALDFSPVSLVSAISFNPDNPDQVAVGTTQNGVFISGDRAKTWIKVPNSEKATLVSGLYWRKNDEIIVSTYGRGLWRVKFNIIIVETPPCNTPNCIHIYYQKPPKQRPSPYDMIIEAFGGQIRGVKVKDGLLEQVYVTPGTTLAYAVGGGATPDIPIIETTASMQSLGASEMPQAPGGASTITGLTLFKSGNDFELEGVLFSPSKQILGPASGPIEYTPRPGSPRPAHTEPTLELTSGPSATPGSPIELNGYGLVPGTAVEIRLDDLPLERTVADQDGAFMLSTTSPGQTGFHVIELYVNGKLVGGAILAVRPGE